MYSCVLLYYVWLFLLLMTATQLSFSLQMDWNDRHSNIKNKHNLNGVQKAMGLPESFEFGDVLDRIFESLLENMVVVHDANIVHRDCEYSFMLSMFGNANIYANLLTSINNHT